VLPGEGRFAVIVADVGQGSAVLLRTRSHLLVYDAGPQYSRDSDAGQRVLLPLLRAIGETRIDVLMLSHRDSDHVGGAAALRKGLPVAQVHSSLALDDALIAGGVPQRRCEAGQRWVWDGVAFEVMHPLAQDYERNRKPNALSCVLRVQGGDASLLLTGDIEVEQEAALVSMYGDALRSELLLVPHHGSRTSSSAALLDAVTPRIALIQAGYRNRFGHPLPEVVQRYRERGIALRLSPDCGAWWREAGGAPQGHCQREAVRRYWQHGAAPAPPQIGPAQGEMR
jgi:competence protein ComEC